MSDAQERIITFGMLTDKEQDALLHDLGIGTESKTPLATIARIAELEEHLQSVLDRETSIIRYYDAKLDAADAKLTVVVDALKQALDSLSFAAHELAAQAHIPQEDAELLRDRISLVTATIAKIKGE